MLPTTLGASSMTRASYAREQTKYKDISDCRRCYEASKSREKKPVFELCEECTKLLEAMRGVPYPKGV